MKIKVNISSKFQQEKKYTIEVLFSYFKNIEIEWSIYDDDDFLIEFQNGKTFKIKDGFFSDLDESQDYIYKAPLPEKPMRNSIDISNTHDLTILYGSAELNWMSEGANFSGDIIASTFFMLTRWEETVSNVKDEHGRFPDSESTAVKNKFYNRPIVNEYIEFLRDVFSTLTDNKIEYNRNYRCFVTHDVDEIFRLRPIGKAIKVLGADLIKRKSLKLFFSSFRNIFTAMRNKEQDPSYTFSYLMDVSEKNGLVSHFYFIPGRRGEEDFRYNINKPKAKELILLILKKNHIVGVHPSYGTFENSKQLKTEKNRLDNQTGNAKVSEGRQHYLRVTIPKTFCDWAAVGLKVDSSIGYHDYGGFRSGICYEYQLFNVLKREKIELMERPLIVMDVAMEREAENEQQLYDKVLELAKTVKKYNGDFVFLWHNNNLRHPYWVWSQKMYPEIIAEIAHNR